jgi:hypothetical protein
MLICCQSIDIDLTLGKRDGYTGCRVPQAKSLLAKQFAEENMKSKVSGVKRFPPPCLRYAKCDFITPPLPHDPWDELGEESRGGNVHEDALIVAACRWKGTLVGL